MTLRRALGILVAMAVLATVPGAGQSGFLGAAPIPIANGSFESPSVLTSGTWGGNNPDDWITSEGGANDVGLAKNTCTGFNNPTANALIDGDQWLFFDPTGRVKQNIAPGQLRPNADYSVRFAQYSQSNHSSQQTGDVTVEIFDGDPDAAGTLLDSMRFNALQAGLGKVRTAALNSGAAATTGGDLWLRLTPSIPVHNSLGRVSIDDVQASTGRLVADQRVNVGLGGKDASASAQNWGGTPQAAIDGSLGSWVHSANTGTNFWEADLGGTIPITDFTVHGRSGLLGRINGGVVSLLDHTGAVVETHTVNITTGLSESVQLDDPVRARSVRIDTSSDYMNFMEIELFADNLALDALTTQSSVWDGFVGSGSEASDGLLGNTTHTATGDPLPTLTIDLREPFNAIDSIILHNRDAGSQSRLSDLLVEVLDSQMNPVASALVNPANVEGSPDTLGVDCVELFGGPRTGQFVRISKLDDVNGEMWLALGEVQVFGQVVPEPTTIALMALGLGAAAWRKRKLSRDG